MIHFLTVEELKDKRKQALVRLGMTLDEAHGQWAGCNCCLINGNWEDYADLCVVKECDWLLGEDSGSVQETAE